MKYVKISYIPNKGDSSLEMDFYDIISCYETFDTDNKQFILQMPNTVDNIKLETLSASKIVNIGIFDTDENNTDENIILTEYTSVSQIHKSYYSANTNTFRTTVYFRKEY